MNDTNNGSVSRRALFGLFTLAACVIIASGNWVYSHQTQAIRAVKLNELKAIGELKTNQIADWRAERLTDAYIYSTGFIRDNFLKWRKTPNDSRLKSEIISRLNVFRNNHNIDYRNMILAAPDGRVLLSLDPAIDQLDSTARVLISRAVSEKETVSSDLYRSSIDGNSHLDVAAPIMDVTNRPAGVFILCIDPEKILFPLIQYWPLPSRSAETLLVRRDGGDVLFLNVLRFRSTPALSIRIPLTRTDLPAVQAILGKTGVFEGIDYRGVRALTDLRQIPDSPWFMVAKVDTGEILAEARFRGGIILLFVLLGIFMAGIMAFYLFNFQERNLFQRLYRAECDQREAQEEIRATLYGIGDGVIATDADGRIRRLNPVAELLTGWAEVEALGAPLKTVFRIVNEDTHEEVENPVDRVLKEGIVVGLANHTVLIARNGTESPIADSGAPIRAEDGGISGVVLVFRDQTEEREAQKALRESEERWRSTLDTMIEGCQIIGLDWRYIYINAAAEIHNRRPKEELLGRRYMDVWPGVEETEVFQGIRRCLEERITMKMENEFQFPDGSRGWFELSIQPVPEGVLILSTDISRRKQSEISLVESESLFRILFEEHIAAKLIIDPDTGVVLDANKAAAAFYGWSQNQLKTMRIQEINTLPPEEVMAAMESAKTQQCSLFNFRHRRADGSVRDVEVFSSRIVSKGKDILHSIIHDVTDRKRAEEALLQSEKSLRQILDSVSFGVMTIGRDKKIRHANRVAVEMAGYETEEEMMGLVCHNYVCPAEVGNCPILDLGQPVAKSEKILLTRDGESVPIIKSVVAITLDGEGVLLESFVDITELKQAEENLRASEERWRSYLENAPYGIFITDETGIFILVNSEVCRLSGYEEYELLSMSIPDLLAPEYIETALAGFVEMSTVGEVHNEYVFLTKNGERQWWSLAAVKLSDTRYLGFTNDISERKQAEEDKEKLQKRLLQSQKMEAIGALAGGIAHDFNNILSAIIGYSELSIQETAEGSQIRSDLQKILQAGNRAKGVVNQILTFSRQQDEGKSPLSIAPIVKEVMKLLQASLPSTILIKTEIKPKIGSVIADPSQIHQVIMNLCTNAAHAMRKAGGTLTVSLDEITVDDTFVSSNPNAVLGRYVRLVVSDTGHGMTSDVMERIFEPYYTTKGPGEGSGLGLSIVHGIVESIQGMIHVYSEEGKGSAFKVFLPVSEQESATVMPRNDAQYSGQGRILFVDDEPDIVEIGARILKSLGYEVVAMTSSVEALEYFTHNHPAIDLVITDMTMPFIPGDELARDILEIRPDMPIIICTGYSDRLSEEDAMAMGIRYYLGKPLLKSEIAEKVHQAIAEKQEERSHDNPE